VGPVLRFVVAGAAVLLVIRFSLGMLRSLAAPLPEPPPAGELRRVKLRFKCQQCGMELRVDHASNEDPEPPRHCMDEMELVAAAD
jgi:hypothetical protein